MFSVWCLKIEFVNCSLLFVVRHIARPLVACRLEPKVQEVFAANCTNNTNKTGSDPAVIRVGTTPFMGGLRGHFVPYPGQMTAAIGPGTAKNPQMFFRKFVGQAELLL